MNTTTPRKVLGLDFDGVCIATTELWTKLYAEKYPDRPIPRPIDIVNWDLTKVFSFSKKEMYEIFDETRMNKSFKYAAPCDSNFHIWINKLREHYDVTVITANPSKCEPFLRYFLGKYGLEDLPIIFTSNSSEKFNHSWDVIIDDSADMANEMKDHPDRFQVLYTQPWNTMVQDTNNVRRAYNFKDVYDQLVKPGA